MEAASACAASGCVCAGSDISRGSSGFIRASSYLSGSSSAGGFASSRGAKLSPLSASSCAARILSILISCVRDKFLRSKTLSQLKSTSSVLAGCLRVGSSSFQSKETGSVCFGVSSGCGCDAACRISRVFFSASILNGGLNTISSYLGLGFSRFLTSAPQYAQKRSSGYNSFPHFVQYISFPLP